MLVAKNKENKNLKLAIMVYICNASRGGGKKTRNSNFYKISSGPSWAR